MKVVLDTNVIVSGLLSPFGAPGEIARMAASGVLKLCYDARIISEYRNVLLRPKFHFDKNRVDALIEEIKVSGEATAAKPLVKGLPDPNDEAFLEIALAGKARCLITGNPKHYPANNRQGMSVISPAEFLELYRGKL